MSDEGAGAPAEPSARTGVTVPTWVLLLGALALGGALAAVGFLLLDDDGGEVDIETASATSTTDTTQVPGTTEVTEPEDPQTSSTTSRPATTVVPTTTSTMSTSSTSSSTTSTTTPAQLNFSLPAVYGSTALTSGFVPDPFVVGIAGGGPVNVAYLGSGCSGYATEAPTFSVSYTAGAFPTLRIYAIASADTALVVNTPGGSWRCVDDSFGTLDPTMDFDSPDGGRYDIWVATFAEGASASGSLYVTESTANHP